MSHVPIPNPQRTAAFALVQQHPGRPADELMSLCRSAVMRSWLPDALLVLREGCAVRVDADGQYWPTG
ncbi:hypothetical protein [Streptomyces sp. NBC_01092]|uniref:hypothetical protein n=1 Tax=Streptomyces sp. NBC_01092 TaxID=2903748 RepID=UPI003868545F|nr:hypothetical protein OG254_38095 [Streptomyces sp. NBC_01092]